MPPQSTNTSFWFLTPSEHDALQMPQEPPQSIPVSPWFRTPSAHVGQGTHGPPQSTASSPWF